MKICVCGFAFSADRTQVVLIEKKRPHWQVGLLNTDEIPSDIVNNLSWLIPLALDTATRHVVEITRPIGL